MSAPVGDSIRRRRGPARPPRGARPPVRWGRLLLLGAVGALGAFGLGYAIAVFLLFPAPAASAPGIAVPSLLGQDSAFAVRELGARGLRLGAVTQLPNAQVGPGAIVAQDALPGQQLRRGATVNVAVSTGAARATLPNVSGYTVSRAAALLGALGFQVTQRPAPAGVPAGHVVSMAPAPGMSYDLPAAVLLTVSSGPLPRDSAAAPDTLRTDSVATPPAGPGTAVPPVGRPNGTPPAPEHSGTRKL